MARVMFVIMFKRVIRFSLNFPQRQASVGNSTSKRFESAASCKECRVWHRGYVLEVMLMGLARTRDKARRETVKMC